MCEVLDQIRGVSHLKAKTDYQLRRHHIIVVLGHHETQRSVKESFIIFIFFSIIRINELYICYLLYNKLSQNVVTSNKPLLSQGCVCV